VTSRPACYPCPIVSVIDQLADLAPERVRPLKRVEFERLVSEGAFDDERIELLGGVIVEMSPQVARHEAAIEALTRVLTIALGNRARVRSQLSFAASADSLPEPDVAVVPQADGRARPSSAHLVVEVSDSSLRKDRRLKASIYAAAGVPEYWIVNLIDNLVEVYTEPSGTGYSRVAKSHAGDRISLGAFPDVEISVGDILG
jgi:Uma2 family endonuclease